MTEGTSPLPAAAPDGNRTGNRIGNGIGEGLRRFFRVAPAHEAVRSWQVGPAVDMAAYHFSWLWMLLPLLALGDRHPMDYAPLVALALTVGFVHRHVTLPGVYLDRAVFSRHPLRFVVAPVLLVAALIASPFLIRHGIPADLLAPGWPRRSVSGEAVIAGVLVVAGAWNIWHVHMQKFGILRLYNAKCPGAPVPSWVDRLLVLGWLPLIVLHLGTRYADVALEQFSAARKPLLPLLSALDLGQDLLLPIASAIAAASVGVFFSTEWNRHRWGSLPRLSMGIGMLGLSASFLFCNPIKVYIAFGFSHAVEYLVFIWAIGRRRYATRSDPPPVIARILRASGWAYPVFGLALAGVYLLTKSWSHYGVEVWDFPTLLVWGVQITGWMRLWGLYQSLLHFYYDGFLWKTREPSFRDAI